MSAGFYKKMEDGSWVYGTKIFTPDYTLTPENRGDGTDGWVWYDEEPSDFTLEAPEEDSQEGRELIINRLTDAAEASGLGVPFASFYYEHRNTILYWVNNGDDSLLEAINNSEEPWLDMREDENTPSLREFAVNLLS